MSRNLRDVLSGNIEASLERHGHAGDDLCWDISHTMIPQPGGFAVINSIIITMRSPILDQPGLTLAMNVPDLLMFKDTFKTDQVIMQMLVGLRDMRAQLLSTSNGEGSSGGLITPP